MTPAPQNSKPLIDCDLERFNTQQKAQVQSLLEASYAALATLNPGECQTLRSLWSLLAQATAPIAISATDRQSDATVQRNLVQLISSGLVWYDDDLRSVLQCPPFSALSTNHSVKAFGWTTAQVCSLIDAPLALLLYGPNTWLTVESICQRSGETLEFQVSINDSQRVRTHTPLEAADWRVWVPASADGQARTDQGQHAAISFYSLADYDTYRQYHSEESGTLFSFYEAMAFSECLIKTYHSALMQ